MKIRLTSFIASVLVACCLLALSPMDTANVQAAGAWRSVLYPTNWLPTHLGGSITADGRFLHDFSYAGYHRGDSALPYGATSGMVISLNAADYGNGMTDATSAIQSAINNVCTAGGGVVNLSAGTFRVRPQGTNTYALRIQCSDFVLRGAGMNATYIFNDETVMRSKTVINVRPSGSTSLDGTASEIKVTLTQDLLTPTTIIPVASTVGFAIGDWVMIRNTITDAFIAEHGMTGTWDGFGSITSTSGMGYLRRVVVVDATNNWLIVDAPTRYPLKVRDNARAIRFVNISKEVGLENFSIGMRQNPNTGYGDEDYTIPGTAAYEVHAANMIAFGGRVVDSWVWRVSSYRPNVNSENVHLLSRGIHFQQGSARITVEESVMAFPQYRGGGGNGYLFLMGGGQDILLNNNVAENGRHNYIYSSFYATGNVVRNSIARNGRYSADFHGFLSPANLFDQMQIDRDFLQAVNRGDTSSGAGHTATQSVYWNTTGIAYVRTNFPYLIETAQYGWGYVIGTQSSTGATGVIADSVSNSYWATLGGDEPTDFVEGVGQGADLSPQSLYLDQRARRVAREASALSVLHVLNTTSDTVLSTLQNGSVITTSVPITLRAVVTGAPGSAIFRLDGQSYVDNQAPFRLSDTGAMLSAGVHTLVISLYPGVNGLDVPTQTVSYTFTYSPSAAVNLQLQLQGRPAAPNERWAVPVRVVIQPIGGGIAVYDETLTANTSGMVTMDGIPPGSYRIWVKQAHTLSALMTAVTLVAATNSVTLGVLREGDADGNNFINITDFSILATSFGKGIGEGGYDARTDFDGSGLVNINDFTLLASNFGMSGAALS